MTQRLPKKTLPPHTAPGLMLALEPRFMFDAAGVATGSDVAVQQAAQQLVDQLLPAEQLADPHTSETPSAERDTGDIDASSIAHTEAIAPIDTQAPLSEALHNLTVSNSNRHEIVFIDTRVADYQSLLNGIDPGAQVVLLDNNSDGVQQIANALSQYQQIDAIHIISHGSAGQLELGNSALNSQTLQARYANDMAIIAQSLTANGDILLYGCDVAAGMTGQSFIDALAAATQADVAASTNSTGADKLGGDWVLEANTSSIEALVPFSQASIQSFEHLLALPTATNQSTALAETSTKNFSGNTFGFADTDSNTLASIILTSLPSASDGALTLNNAAVNTNDVINVADLGMLVYTPANKVANYATSFQFKVTDSNNETSANNYTYTLNVTASNDAPTAVADNNSIAEDSVSVSGNVLDNDTDPDTGDTKTVTVLTSGTVGVPLTGTFGSLTLNANGSYTYTLDNTNPLVQALGVSSAPLTDSFNYTMQDAASATSTASLDISITGTNDQPIITASAIDLTQFEDVSNVFSVNNLLTNASNQPIWADVDAGSMGIAITDAPNTDASSLMTGTWQYQLDGGSWTDFPAVSASAALLLPGDAQVRFVVNTDNQIDSKNSGGVSLTYAAWDGSSGTAATTAGNDTTSPSSTSPYSSASNTATLNVTPVNDAPTFTASVFEVNEHASATFTQSFTNDSTQVGSLTGNFRLYDPDNSTAQILYRIEELPTKGTLTLNGATLTVGSLFAQSNISSVIYTPTVAELSADTSDRFYFTIRDGAGGIIGETGKNTGNNPWAYLDITIRDVNAPISVSGTTLAIAEDNTNPGVPVIAAINLSMSDADDPSDLKRLTVTSLPTATFGTLQYWDGSSYQTATTGLVFTQAQLTDATHPALRFIYNNSTEPTDQNGNLIPAESVTSFSVHVEDNNGHLTETTADATVSITISPSNDAPILTTSTLTVNQGSTNNVISGGSSGNNLFATDPDSPASQRIYTVSIDPSRGYLTLDGVRIGRGSTFTEADLTSGKLKYTANDPYYFGSDSLDVVVADGDGADSGVHTLNIVINDLGARRPVDTGSNGGDTASIGGILQGISPEGLFLTLDAGMLNDDGTDATFTINTAPAHGKVYLNGIELVYGTSTFSQSDIGSGNVVYVHDSSEASGYSFTDSLSITASKGAATVSKNFTITITPVDDAPTITQTTAGPINTNQGGTTLMEQHTDGSNGMAAADVNLTGIVNAVKLSTANFQWHDIDNNQSQLTYIASTVGGSVGVWNGTSWVASTSFSADDLAAGNVAYFHDPAADVSNPADTTMTGSVSVYLIDGGTVATGDVQISAGSITESATLTVNDGSNTLSLAKNAQMRSPTRTVTFTVTDVNDAPIANDTNFKISEFSSGLTGQTDHIQVLNTSLISASDADTANGSWTYTLTALPIYGNVQKNISGTWTDMALNDTFTYTQLNTGELRYVNTGRVEVTSGFSWNNPSDSFKFKVNDGETTSPPNSLESNEATVSIFLRPINQPPVVVKNGPGFTPEGGALHITGTLLGSAEAPNDADIVAAVDPDHNRVQVQYSITGNVSKGILYLGNPTTGAVSKQLAVGSAFTLEDIQLGKIWYQHDGTESNAYSNQDSFTYSISDASGMPTPTATFIINIIPVNDAPVVTGLAGGSSFTEGDTSGSPNVTPILIDGSVVLADPDLANNEADFRGGSLTISNTFGSKSFDQLSIKTAGLIAYNPTTGSLTYNGVSIGTVDISGGSTTDGINGHDLKINFDTNANTSLTIPAIKALIEAISFSHSEYDNAITGIRTLNYTLIDGGGTTSYTDDKNISISGQDTWSGSATVTVTAANDRPVLTPHTGGGNLNLGSITEDNTTPSAFQVSSFTTGSADGTHTGIADVDTAARGIAITGLANAATGHWEYSANGTTGWTSISGVSATNALLLSSTDYVRFVPDAKNGGTATFTYRAWDTTSGTLHSYVNPTTNNTQTSAFSTASDTAQITVTEVNDAPTGTGNLTLTSITEDTPNPTGAAINTLTGLNFQDIDTGASLAGVAVIGNTAILGTQGEWQYSTSTGNWKSIGTVADDNTALVLSANTQVRFVPAANYNGTPPSLTIRALDNSYLGSFSSTTGGTETRETINSAVNGTNTAISANTNTIATSVTPVNDEPTISPDRTISDAVTENSAIIIASAATTPTSVYDVEAERNEGSGANQGLVSVTIAVPNGLSHGKISLGTTADISITAGANNSNTVTIKGTLAAVNTAIDGLSFTPGDDTNTSETVTVTVNDLGNNGTGSTTALTAPQTITINNITPVNDKPTLTRPTSVTATEDTQFSFTGSNTVSIADVDARSGTVEVALSIPTGTLTLTPGSTNVTVGSLGSNAFTLQGTVADINTALATLKYTPALDANNLNSADANRTLSINVSDLGNGIGGATTTAQTVSSTTLINVTAVNDTPTLDIDTTAGIQTTRTTTISEKTTTPIIDIVLADAKDINDSGYGSNTNIVITSMHGILSLDASTGVTAVQSGSPSGRSITLTGSIADINAAISASHLNYTPDGDFSGNDTLSLVFHDAGNSGASFVDRTAPATISLLITGNNDAPSFTGLGGGSVGSPDVTFTEDGAAMVLDANATVSDPELSTYNNWGGAVLTLQRNATTGNAGVIGDDVYSLTGSGTTGVNFNSSNIRIGATIVGSFTNSAGVLSITFNDATTTAQVNQVLQAIKYSNSNNNPPSSVTVGYIINDGNTNTGATAQGNANPTLALIGSGQVIVGITANNDTPAISSIPATTAINEDAAAITLAGSAVISDPELSFLASQTGDWGGAILSLNRSGGANANDIFSVTGSGDTGVNFNGGNIRIGTDIVGTFSNNNGTLAITFASGVTTAQAEQVARAITYSNSRQSLAAGQTESIPLVWTLNDGNATPFPQGLGGAKQTTFTETVTLTGVNDAPILADTALSITQTEDAAVPSGAVGVLVSSLTGGISDADTSNPKGIAITATDSNRGTWYYSTAATPSWTSFTATDSTARLLLADANTRIYFQPNANWQGSITSALTIRAWDASTGSNGGTANLSVPGTSTGTIRAFSAATDVVDLTVTSVNDQPTATSNVTLGAFTEDVTTPAGTALNTLAFGYSDVIDNQTSGNAGNIAGGDTSTSFSYLAIVGSTSYTAGQGVWQISKTASPNPSNASDWISVPTSALSTSAALIFNSDSQVRFVPAANYFGTPGTLSVRLADASASLIASTSASDTKNLSSNGGTGTTGAWNTTNRTISTTVTGVNDAPTLTSGAALTAVNEDISSASNTGSSISSLFGSKYADSTDTQSGITGGGNTASAFAGLAILGNTANAGTQGIWQYSVSAGIWLDLPVGANLGTTNDAVILPTAASLRFQPAANYNGTPPNLSVSALDSSGGSIASPLSGQTINTTGGTTRYSTPTTLSALVNPVNDAPTITDLSGTPVITEQQLTAIRLDGDGSVTAFDQELNVSGSHWNQATLSVQRSGTASADDVFSFIDESGIAGDNSGVEISANNVIVDSTTIGSLSNTGGVLTVTFNSNATATLVGKAMGAVAYRNTSDTPPANVQINFVLNDKNSNTTGGGSSGGGQNQGAGGQLSTLSSVNVAITAVNDAPSITGLDVTRTGNFIENGVAIQIDSNVVLADAELDASNWNKASLTLARNGGANADDIFGATGIVSFTGSGSGNVVVSGITVGSYSQANGSLVITFNSNATAASADNVIQGLTYKNTSEDPGAAVTLHYEVNDQNPNISGIDGGTAGTGIDQGTGGLLIASGDIIINISQNNDAPVISAAPPAVSYTEQLTPAFVDAGLTLSDADDTQMASASVTISPGTFVSGDLLTVDTTGTSIGAIYNSTTGVLTLSGPDTTAHYEQVLRSLSFSSSSDDPTVNNSQTSRSLTIAVTDANSDGAGAQTTTTTRSVNITAVNDTPTLTGTGSTVAYTENASAIALESAVVLADVDDSQFDQAVIAISSGFIAGDRLNFTDQAGITGSYNALTGVLTLSGTATVAQYQTALQSISFDSASENPGNGNRTLSWTVRDVNSDAAANGKQTSLAGTTTIQVTAVNDPPLAFNDSNSRGKADTSPATGNVLSNDSDIDGGVLTVTAISGGSVDTALVRSNGTLTLYSTGSYSFSVNTINPTVAALGAGDTLLETYEYSISDGQGGSASAQLIITIHGSNDAPVANADSNSLNEGDANVSAVASGVLLNDSDLNSDPLTVTGIASGADQAPASAIPVSSGGTTLNGNYGSLLLNPDGSYTYTLDNTKPAINALAVGEQLTDSFTYVISDGKGGTASTNLVITINGTNDGPAAVNDVSSLQANAPNVLGQALINDSDPDTSDTLVVSAVNADSGKVGVAVAGSYGSIIINSDGSYSFTPNSTTAVALAAGETASDSFTYTISDGHGVTATATITINLTGTNDTPTANADSNTLTEKQTTATGNVITGAQVTGAGSSSTVTGSIDTDPDTSDTLTVIGIQTHTGTVGAIGNPLTGTYGSVTLNDDGSYSYALDNTHPLVQSLPAGASLHDSFSYTLSDGQGGTDSATLDIEIVGVNDAPLANNDHFDTVDTAGIPNTPITGNLLNNDSDPDAGATLSVSGLVAGTPGGTPSGNVGGSGVAGTYGTLTVNPDGTFSYDVDQTNATVIALLTGESRTETYTYAISDGLGGFDTATVTFTIHGTNNAPAAQNDLNLISEDETAATGNVISGARTTGSGISSTIPGSADIDPNADLLTVSAVRLADPLLAAGAIGTPYAGDYGNLTLNADGSYSYQLDNSKATVQALKAGETRTETFTYTVNDGRGSFIDASLTIQITGVNDAPVVTPDSNDISEDATVPTTGNVLLNDSDVDHNAVLTITGLSAGTSGSAPVGNVGGSGVDGSFGTLTLHADGIYAYVIDNGNPAVQALAAGETVDETYTYAVTDDQGAISFTTLTITLHGLNDAPVAVADTLNINAGSADVSSDLTPGTPGQDYDVDSGNTINVTGFTNANNISGSVGSGSTLGAPLSGLYGSLQVAEDGSQTYTLDNANTTVLALKHGQSTNETFNYTIGDGNGAYANSTLTITIHGRNDPPIAKDDSGFETNEDTPLNNILVLPNDSDPDNDTLTVSNAFSPNGTVSINPGGSLNFSPAPNFNGIATIDYTISDGNGGTSTATVTINVIGVNDAPIISVGGSDSAAKTLSETNIGLTGSGTLTVTDVDINNTVTTSVISVVSSGNSTGLASGNAALLAMLSVDAGNVIADDTTTGIINWAFDSGSETFDYLASGEQLVLTYTIRATDSNSPAESDDQTIIITINGTNDIPVITTEDLLGAVSEQTGTPTGNLTDSGVIGFSDVDLTDVHLVSATGTPLGSGYLGSLTAVKDSDTTGSGSGGQLTWTYTVPAGAVEYLAAGETKVESFTITLSDQQGGIISKQIDVTLTGTNDAPIISVVDVAGTVTESGTLSDSGTITFTDVDLTDRPTATATTQSVTATRADNSSVLTLTAGQLADIEAAFAISAGAGNSNNGTIDWNYSITESQLDFLAAGETVTAIFTITVDDQHGGTDTQDVSIIIHGSNDSPVIKSEDLLGAVSEQTGTPTGNLTDSGIIEFNDVDLTDVHLVSATGTPLGSGYLGSLTAVKDSDTTGSGSGGQLTWTYTVPASAIEYLAAGETKVESFTITLTDQHGGTITKQIDVTLTSSNDAPIISVVDVAGSITEGGTLSDSGTITFSDVDLTDRPTATATTQSVTATRADNSSVLTLTAGQLADIEAAFAINAGAGNSNNGTINWDYNITESQLDFLAAGETVTAVFTITVNDQHGGTDTQDVSIIIHGSNDSPVIKSEDLLGAVSEQTGTPTGNLTDSGVIGFSDVDLTDVHLVSATGTPLGSGYLGSLTTVKDSDTTGSGNGGQLTWTYTVPASAIEYLAAGETKMESFTITLSDQQGGIISKQIDVTLTGSNDAPIITTEDLLGAVSKQTGTPTVNLTDSGVIGFSDVDLTDVHLVSATGTPVGTGHLGSLTAVKDSDTTSSGSGGQLTWTYTVPASAIEYLAAGETKVESFTITLTDQHGGTITEQIDVTLTSSNDAPIISVVDVAGSITEGGTLSDSGTITFTDVDLTDRPTATAATKSVTATQADNSTTLPLSPVQLADIEAAFAISAGAGNSNTGTIDWDYSITESQLDFLAAGETVTAVFTITVNDQHGGTDTQDVTVIIHGANDTPVITTEDLLGAVSEQTGTPTGNLTDSGVIGFSDVDLTDVHLISATGTPVGTGHLGSLTAVKDSDTTGSGSGGELTWTYTVPASAIEYLAAGETKVESFTITLSDQQGGIISKQIDVTLTGTNDAPIITTEDLLGAVSEQTGTPTGNLTDSGVIGFSDVDLTDVHLVSATGTPLGSGYLGSLTAVKDSDTTGSGNGGQLTWTYTVPAGAVEYLAAGETKVESFTITLTDQHGGTITKQIDVTLTSSNDAPIISVVDVAGSITEGGTLSDSGTITFTDVDLTDRPTATATTQSVTATRADNSTLLTLTAGQLADIETAFAINAGAGNSNNGTIDWDYSITESQLDFLAAGETVTAVFTITVDDQHGGTDTQDVTVIIHGSNDSPVIKSEDLLGAVSEQTGTPSGNLTDSGVIGFSDVDLTDVHLISATGTPLGSGYLGSLTTVKDSDTTGSGSGGELTWTYTVPASAIEYLAAGETKMESFTITLSDQQGGIISKQIDVTLTGTNDAPVISLVGSDSATETLTETNAGMTGSGTLTVTDVDISNTVAPSVISVVTGGNSTGLLSDNAALLAMLLIDAGNVIADDTTTGVINWAFDSGSEAFDYLASGEQLVLTYTVRATDSNSPAASDDQTITLIITGTNDAPFNTLPSALSTAEDTPLPINGLSITDIDSNSLSTTLSVPADAGKLVVNTVSGLTITGNDSNFITLIGTTAQINAALGSLIFNPAPDYHTDSGSINLTLVTTDNDFTVTDTLAINITPVIDISDDSIMTDEDTAITLNLLSNDSFEGIAAITDITQGDHGTVVINLDGTVTYTPALNYNGSDSFSYSVTSGGVVETATVSVSITPITDLTATDTNLSTDEDTALNGSVAGDSATTSGGSLSFAVATGPSHGSLVLNSNGDYTYTPDADYNGADSFTYTVSDSVANESLTQTVNLAINPVTDIVSDALTTPLNTPISFNPITGSNGASQDNFEALSPQISAINGSAIAVGQTVSVTNGTIGLGANNLLTFTPGTGFHGNVPALTYTVSTGGITETATINILVNSPPQAADDHDIGKQGLPISGNLLGNDSDPDSDILTVSEFSIDGMLGTFLPGDTIMIPGVGSFWLSASGQYTFNPLPTFFGNVPAISYTITDGNGSFSSAVFKLDIAVEVKVEFDDAVPPDNLWNADRSLRPGLGFVDSIRAPLLPQVDMSITTTLPVISAVNNGDDLNGMTAIGERQPHPIMQALQRLGSMQFLSDRLNGLMGVFAVNRAEQIDLPISQEVNRIEHLYHYDDLIQRISNAGRSSWDFGGLRHSVTMLPHEVTTGSSDFLTVHTTLTGNLIYIEIEHSVNKQPKYDVQHFTARQTHGQALPDWLSFDAKSGVLSGIPPAGNEIIRLRVSIELNDGRLLSGDVQIVPDDGRIIELKTLDKAVGTGKFSDQVSESAGRFQTELNALRNTLRR